MKTVSFEITGEDADIDEAIRLYALAQNWHISYGLTYEEYAVGVLKREIMQPLLTKARNDEVARQDAVLDAKRAELETKYDVIMTAPKKDVAPLDEPGVIAAPK